MRDIQIIRVDPTTREVFIEFPNPPRLVSGIFYLVQQIVMELVQTPGTYVFDSRAGAGLESLLSGRNDSENELSMQMDLSIALGQVTERIKARQAGAKLIADERLRDLVLERVTQESTTGTWFVDVRVVPESGRPLRVDIGKVVFADQGIRSRQEA